MAKQNKPNLLIKAMEGIGDQIYHRPFLKKLVENNNVYIVTFLHELYADINGLKFVDPMLFAKGTYRTQLKQSKNQKPITYDELPRHYATIDPSYNGMKITHTSIVACMFDSFNIEPTQDLSWTLPAHFKHMAGEKLVELGIKIPKKIAVIRPATVRAEWEVHSRNPKDGYISWCSKVLRENGYTVFSLADLKERVEWLVGSAPVADYHLHKGELNIYETLGLIDMADVVVGGPGFITPATVSSKKAKLFTLFGGRMGFDTPYKIFHHSMDMQRIGWAVPNNPCKCTSNKHNCDKTINDLDTRFMEFMSK